MPTSTKSPFVYVITLTWNGIHHLKECLDSLLEMDYENYHILLVDNASDDGSPEFVGKCYPMIKTLRNKKNLQFAVGMNKGIEYAIEQGAEYIALVNDDTIADKMWLSEMIKLAQKDEKIGAVASRMMYSTNRNVINGIGVDLNRLAYAIDRYQGKLFKKPMAHSTDVISFSGGACLLRTFALKQVGLFDHRFVAYLEDVDLSIRLNAGGWRIVTAPQAIIYHRYSGSWKQGSAKQEAMIFRNRLMVIAKYYPVEEILREILPRIARERVRLVCQYISNREWRRLWLMNKVILNVCAMMPGLLKFRATTKGKFGYKLYSRLLANFIPDVLPYPMWDYERSGNDNVSFSRIIMGVTDGVLGDGWYPLCNSTPQYRWMGDCADCYVAVEKSGSSVIQIHLKQPLRLNCAQQVKVLINGDEIGIIDITDNNWVTRQLPCTVSGILAKITLCVSPVVPANPAQRQYDRGVQVNEISLLPAGSVFIRRIAGG